MPQLPTSTAEAYGAEDEVKEYRQEEESDEEIDVVNDIKDDLIKEDGPELRKPAFDGYFGSKGIKRVPFNDIPPYYPRPVFPPPGIHVNGPPRPRHPEAFPPTTTQLHFPVNRRVERPHIERVPWPPSRPPPPVLPPPMLPPPWELDHRLPRPPLFSLPFGYPMMPPGMPPHPPQEMIRPHVKKPLNAFLLFMKQHRQEVAAEFTLKESSAINQILGKRWQALDKSEQAKYYEMAREQRERHMELYPGWSARENYNHAPRKRRKRRDKGSEPATKKCRARFGLNQVESWCQPCRRKKKCIRFLEGTAGENAEAPPQEQIEHSNDSADSSDSEGGELLDSKEGLQKLVQDGEKLSGLFETLNDTSISTDTVKSIAETLPNTLSPALSMSIRMASSPIAMEASS